MNSTKVTRMLRADKKAPAGVWAWPEFLDPAANVGQIVKGIAIREAAAASGLVIAALASWADVVRWTGGCQESSGGIEEGISAEKQTMEKR